MGLLQFLMIVHVANSSQTALRRTYCQSRGNQLASITCIFPNNLQEIKDSFCVSRILMNETETVLVCKIENGKSRCYSKYGFQLIQQMNVTFEVNVHVPNNSIGAHFSCNTIPPHEDTLVEQCHLPFPQGSLAVESPTSTTPDHLPKPDSLERTVNNKTTDNETFFGLLSCVVISGALNITLIVCLLNKKSVFVCWRAGTKYSGQSNIAAQSNDLMSEKGLLSRDDQICQISVQDSKIPLR